MISKPQRLTAVAFLVLFSGMELHANEDELDLANDVLGIIVDPSQEGVARRHFLTIAGKDTEVDAQEFNAAAQKGEWFIPRFFSWEVVSHYDRDKNSKLDWIESYSLHRAFRRWLIQAADKNGDGRLAKDERIKAAQLLAGSRREFLAHERAVRQAELEKAKFRDEYFKDRNGDGQFDSNDRRIANQQKRDALDAEKRAWRKGARFKDLDRDNDGVLNDLEYEVVIRKRIRPVELMFDKNKDGVLSEGELRSMNQSYEYNVIMSRIEADQDRDGFWDWDERRQAVINSIRVRRDLENKPERRRELDMELRREIELVTYDTNGNGMLDDPEIAEYLKAVNDGTARGSLLSN